MTIVPSPCVMCLCPSGCPSNVNSCLLLLQSCDCKPDIPSHPVSPFKSLIFCFPFHLQTIGRTGRCCSRCCSGRATSRNGLKTGRRPWKLLPLARLISYSWSASLVTLLRPLALYPPSLSFTFTFSLGVRFSHPRLSPILLWFCTRVEVM